ncbi:SsrA-binding protein SmpB [Candidatus Peribacteria bacterium]|jgi:SsrA-binding protein|nr:SsrA-binding protein SmpB [Candidatus Peribacteria bacterium]MBT4020855.1 SsrA-binding protein SmpB [Candidatus Peribacteria bacterium]MBT4241144.1 SsrA-binding protein SmpB [Candidatus Peribacteria bacterium]MBT4473866.1 SsrA-binding protein SmpB [Candidatus Peribacteria bacterium]
MKLLAKNKKATFDYEILEKIETGIVLTGQEVKSARGGNVDLRGSYISFVDGRPIMKKSKIQPYKYASNLGGYDPERDRELLMKKKEVARFIGLSEENGISIIPLEVLGGRTIKILIAAGRGRKKYDKRQRIKERDIEKRIKKTGDY